MSCQESDFLPRCSLLFAGTLSERRIVLHKEGETTMTDLEDFARIIDERFGEDESDKG
jgi:hypothetical protein